MTKSQNFSSSSSVESDGSSSSSASTNEGTFIETIAAKTLTSGLAGTQPIDMRHKERSKGSLPGPEEDRRGTSGKPAPSPSLAPSSSSNSTYKRYKFGLTNHFLTLPDADPKQEPRVYQQRELLNQQINKRHKHRYRSAVNNESRAPGRGALRAHQSGPSDGLRQQRDDDSDCDQSGLAPSSSNSLNLSLSDEQENATATTSNLAHSSSDADCVLPTRTKTSRQHATSSPVAFASNTSASGGTPHSYDLAANGKTSDQHFNGSRLLLPAGDAGLDASRCNSRASQQRASSAKSHPAAECYLDLHCNNNDYNDNNNGNMQHAGSSRLQKQQQQPPTRPVLSDGGGDENEAHHHHLRKKLKLSGDQPHDQDCASNGLLVRLSSIMYATFLVILGCILHVSELRQKSRNSSDHIYTTIVALVGIFWLLFLQGDLQRYKRYASKFILLESIFNDHQRQQLQHQIDLKRSPRGDGLSPTAAGGLLRVDPSARSTTSSSASLVHDRMSMNTEVIFKKTAYKMYQQQAAAPAPPAPQVSSSYKFAVGNPLKYHQQQPFFSAAGTLGEPATPRLVPAYKFLHGKMGANFYLKCGMAAFCFGHVIHEGLRFGQQVYFFATGNAHCRDSAALVAHLVTPLYSFYQLFMMFKYSNLVINRHKVLARFGLMHIIGTCVTFWFRTILEEAFEDFVHKMDYFKAQNKPIIHYLDPTAGASLIVASQQLLGSPSQFAQANSAGLAHSLSSLASLTGAVDSGAHQGAHPRHQVPIIAAALDGTQPRQNLTQLAQSTLLALMSSPMSATITPQLVRHLPDSYHCAQNTLLTTKSMNALPYLYPFTIEYNLLIAAIFLSLYFNIGKLDGSGAGQHHHMLNSAANRCHLACCEPPAAASSASVALGSSYYEPGNHTGGQHNAHAVAKQPANSSSGASFIGSALDASDTSSSLFATNRYTQIQQQHQLERDKFAGEYKSNFVVNADCHAANKGLFLGFFVLLVTLVTIVIFFVTINKPSHLQLGIKINLIQEATLTSLILIVTLAGYRQIMRLNQNPFIKNNITTDDVLMLIPLPFFFIHSLLSIRAETATLYSPHHLTIGKHQQGAQSVGAVEGVATAATRALNLDLTPATTMTNNSAAGKPRANFMLGLSSGLSGVSGQRTMAHNSTPGGFSLSTGTSAHAPPKQRQQDETTRAKQQAAAATPKIDHYKLLTIVLNLAVMIEVLVQTNFIIDGLRRCSESRYLRFKKPGRELITFAIILNITYWIVATFETKSVEQYKTEIDYYGPLPYMFISHTTLPVMLFYRYHSSVCLAEIWNRAYKPPKRR